jgi:hypothetical protein
MLNLIKIHILKFGIVQSVIVNSVDLVNLSKELRWVKLEHWRITLYNQETKEEKRLKTQAQVKDLADKTLDFMLQEVEKNHYKDAVYFAAIKALHDYVRALMVQTYGEKAIRDSESKILVLSPTTDWKE